VLRTRIRAEQRARGDVVAPSAEHHSRPETSPR
jgi:hypothetical protein